MLKLIAMKAARSWYATDSGRFQIPILAIQLVTMGLILLSTRAAWTSGGPQRLLACGIWGVIAYFWGMTVLVLSIARYMVPAIGLAFLLLPALLFDNAAVVSLTACPSVAIIRVNAKTQALRARTGRIFGRQKCLISS